MQFDQFLKAAGLLEIALKRTARDYPFHAGLLSAGAFRPDPSVGTVGVTVRGGKVVFLNAPAFVCGCALAELAGVLHHEVNHVLFGHVFADPNDYPDREARVIAEEVTVNEWVAEPLPGSPLTLAGFPRLPPGEDTDARYARLAQNRSRKGPKSASSGPESPGAGPKHGRCGRKCPGVGQETCSGVQPLDNHEVWAEARANPVLGKLAVAEAVRRARQALAPDQWLGLPAGLRELVERACRGHEAGGAEEELAGPGRGGLDWRRLLRRHVSRALERRPSLDRPPRRFPGLVGVIPGGAPRAGRHRVMAVLDTSGSITAADLGRIDGELALLSRAAEVVVVECDARVQATYPYRGPLQLVRGRGGTDLRPPLEAGFLGRSRPDVVVYFTDGDGPAPATPPRVPVIWCLTATGRRPAAWGREVRMSAPPAGAPTC